MSETHRIYLATKIDRAWHWLHAVLILALILTGFNIHFPQEFNVFGSFETAVKAHNFTGVLVSIDWGVWLIYNLTTRRIKYYLPNGEDLIKGVVKQARFYLYGIFKGEGHPFHTDEKRKFNPLQKWTYLAVMAFFMPFQIITGVVLLYLVPSGDALADSHLRLYSILHTLAAFALTAFVVGHIYLATTGHNPLSLFKFMITGWHEAEPKPAEDKIKPTGDIK